MSSKKALSLTKIAERDIEMARKLIGDHNDGAAFHLQQAAEKLLKGILTAHRGVFPTTSHQMDELLRHLPTSDPFYGDFVDFTGLTSAATSYRYPTPSGDVPQPPDLNFCKKHLDKLTLILPEVRNHIAEFEQAPPKGKPRK